VAILSIKLATPEHLRVVSACGGLLVLQLRGNTLAEPAELHTSTGCVSHIYGFISTGPPSNCEIRRGWRLCASLVWHYAIPV